MKCVVLHENRGRLRVHMAQSRMSLRQADALADYLNGLDGVREAKVYERTCDAVILYTGRRQDVRAALARFRYDKAACSGTEPENSSRALSRQYQEKLVRLAAGYALRRLFLPAPLQAAYAAVRALPYIWRGLRTLLGGNLRVEVLDAISIGVSILRRDFGTAGTVMALLRTGELLEEWTHKKSVSDLARSMSLNVDKVWLQTPAGEVLAPLTQVQAGDCIRVRTGSLIPLDGKAEAGEAMVNQASLTGESVPIPKRPGSVVYAGTVVEEGSLVIRVTNRSGASRYDRIVAMIEDSEKLKSATESRAASLADKLVPYSLLGTIVTFLLTGNVTRAISILMVDFSCALKLAMPLAVLSAMREAGRYRITVKGGKYLEAVAGADTLVFDKTGTLTKACPTVVEVIPFGGGDRDEMLRIAACLEEHYPHSMANAVVRAAKEKGLTHDEMHAKVEYVVAHGISSTIEDKRVVIGSQHFVFEDEGCIVPAGEEEKFQTLPAAYSHLYLAIGGRLAAVICIADPLRPEAAEVIAGLRKQGVPRLVMMTGDSCRTAEAIARQVGVDEYHAEVLPEDKAAFVEAERAAGRTVVMVGDGINDSPALSAADAGVAISDGAAIAREIADITIAADDLRELLCLKQLADALMRRIRFNYRTVMGFNGALIALGALGVLPPAVSALLHNASTLAISLKSMTNLLGDADAESPKV